VQTRRPPGPQWLLRLTGRQSVCQRRSFVRADVVLPVLLQLEGGEREVTALDISEGGLRCSTPDRGGLSGGTVVGVHLDLDPLVLDLRAEVVRARHPAPERPLDLGLRFLDLSIKDADRLRAWIFTELRRVRANAG
jgi:c-di-GMP-binding flagellar brake protein YcgR